MRAGQSWWCLCREGGPNQTGEERGNGWDQSGTARWILGGNGKERKGAYEV